MELGWVENRDRDICEHMVFGFIVFPSLLKKINCSSLLMFSIQSSTCLFVCLCILMESILKSMSHNHNIWMFWGLLSFFFYWFWLFDLVAWYACPFKKIIIIISWWTRSMKVVEKISGSERFYVPTVSI